MVVERHPVLRTSLRWEELDEPLQVVHASVAPLFEIVDLRGLTPERQQALMDDYRFQDVDRGFDLTEAPLARVVVFRLSESDHRMMLTIHHIIIDEWSSETLLHGPGLYLYRSAGAVPALPPAVPYRDYVDWLHGQDMAKAESFWRRLLDGFDEPTELGATANESAVPQGVLDTIDAERTKAIQQFASRHGLTLNTVIQGAFAVLVSRHTRREDDLHRRRFRRAPGRDSRRRPHGGQSRRHHPDARASRRRRANGGVASTDDARSRRDRRDRANGRQFSCRAPPPLCDAECAPVLSDESMRFCVRHS